MTPLSLLLCNSTLQFTNMISTSTNLFLQTPPPPVNLFSSGDSNTVLSPSSVRFRQSNNFTAAASATCTSVETEFCYSPVTSPAASFYEILGIHSAATIPEIKAAYRKLARVSHPDVAAKDTSADDFMKIHAAYCTLLDPEKRADYDLRLSWRLRGSINLYSRGCVPSTMSGYTPRNWETDQCW